MAYRVIPVAEWTRDSERALQFSTQFGLEWLVQHSRSDGFTEIVCGFKSKAAADAWALAQPPDPLTVDDLRVELAQFPSTMLVEIPGRDEAFKAATRVVRTEPFSTANKPTIRIL